MSTQYPASGFLTNDLDYAPFGRPWLRGITPERLAIVLLVCAAFAVANVRRSFVLDDLSVALYKYCLAVGRNMAFALPMFLMVVRADVLTMSSPGRVRIAGLTLAVLGGALAFTALHAGVRLLHHSLPELKYFWEFALGRFMRSAVMGGLLAATIFLAARERRAERALHENRAAQVEGGRQLAEARLQLLLAQIEPHFLFNSLATIKRLYEGHPAEARLMLRHLRTYLHGAVLQARQPEARLGEEIALARSFLAICHARMGPRLAVHIDVPPELESAILPSLMVGTLVENAVKHGIAPRASGGMVSLTATRQGDFIQLAVGDDGVGFRASRGDGVGLSNIRARLENWLGGTGSLEIAAAAGGGVTATLRIPHRLATSVLA